MPGANGLVNGTSVWMGEGKSTGRGSRQGGSSSEDESIRLLQEGLEGRSPRVLAERLEQVMREAPGLAQRSQRMGAAGSLLARLASALRDAPAAEQGAALASLSRTFELLGKNAAAVLSAALAGGLGLVDGNERLRTALAQQLGRALREGPNGASFSVQLAFALRDAGARSLAGQVFHATASALHDARVHCQEVARAIRTAGERIQKLRGSAQGEPQGEVAAALEQAQRQREQEVARMEAAAMSLASMLQGAGLAILLRPYPPRARPVPEMELDGQALLALGAIDLVGPTAAGQSALAEAAVAQARGERSFLDVLPRVAADLSSPEYEAFLGQNGIAPMVFRNRGRDFLGRVAEALGRAAVGAVLALHRAGQTDEAGILLRSLVGRNCQLFGLRDSGGDVVGGALGYVLEAVTTRRFIPPLEWLETAASFHAAFRGLQVAGSPQAPVVPRAVQSLGVALVLAFRGSLPPRRAPTPAVGIPQPASLASPTMQGPPPAAERPGEVRRDAAERPLAAEKPEAAKAPAWLERPKGVEGLGPPPARTEADGALPRAPDSRAQPGVAPPPPPPAPTPPPGVVYVSRGPVPVVMFLPRRRSTPRPWD